MVTAAKGVGTPAGGVLPKGFVRPSLLLLISESPAHGYDLLDRLERLAPPAVDAGTLYRALRALERDGWIRSRWEVSAAGPARRIYWITPQGRQELSAWIESLAETRRMIDQVLRRHATLGRD